MSTHESPELFTAVYEGDDDAVVRLLRSGVSAESADPEGQTALYAAAVGDATGVVRLLLAAGADPDRLSAGADAPLCGAACGGHVEVVRALLSAGATPDLAEEYGFRALTWAVRRGCTEVVRVLLAAGADPNLPGPEGEPPLVAAARRGSPGCVEALVAHGARGREQALATARRWTGLDVAAELRAGLEAAYGPGHEYVTRRWEEEPGTVTVEVSLLRDGRPAAGNDQQTGHAAIVALLAAGDGVEAGR
ncbi:ankyrin repeat domain-containing protein [Streptomyces sp. NPDC048664]|uniref:ankyrin repeat domain-containing protein n=1 Tax=Streptomyces sp. NPDC048664 TaxID=3154505 RepID=UPI00341B3145